MLAGNLASIGTGGVIAVATSLIWPEDFTFERTQAMNAPPGSRYAPPVSPNPGALSVDEKHEKSVDADVRSVASHGASVAAPDESDLDPASLERAFRFAAWASIVLVRPSPASRPITQGC